MAHHVSDHQRHRLSVPDVRAVLRLCNELHLAAQEGDGRKRKLLEGIRELTDSDHASSAVVSFVGGDATPVSVIHLGAREHQASRAKTDLAHDSCAAPWELYRGRTRRRRGATGGDGASPGTGGAFRLTPADACKTMTLSSAAGPAGGRCAHSCVPLADGRVVACLTIRRSPSRPRFTQRERAMVCALHAEVGWVYRADVMRVAPETRSLSPREQETLQHLLAGKGEKQIAAEMALRYNTIHHYVKAVYRHFCVSSRSELLARWVGR